MTARDLELEKIKRLAELAKEKNPVSASKNALLCVTRDGDRFDYILAGSATGLITAAFAGLHKLEEENPKMRIIIDTGLEMFKEMRKER